ncbi:unnamed protein product, partial [Aphanomyces euteiches]
MTNTPARLSKKPSRTPPTISERHRPFSSSEVVQLALKPLQKSPTRTLQTVTILEANRQLLHNCRLKDGFRDQLVEKLAKLNVHVIRGERLPERLKTHSFTATTVVTDKGTEIQSDVQLVCAGLTPNADL